MPTYVEVVEPQAMGNCGEPPDRRTFDKDWDERSTWLEKEDWDFQRCMKEEAERCRKWTDEWESARKQREEDRKHFEAEMEKH